MNHGDNVVHPMPVACGQADQEDGQQLRRACYYLTQRLLGGVEHGVLHQKVVHRVTRECQFREYRQPDALVMAGACGTQNGHRVHPGLDNCRGNGAGCRAEETVPIAGAEVHRSPPLSRRVRPCTCTYPR